MSTTFQEAPFPDLFHPFVSLLDGTNLCDVTDLHDLNDLCHLRGIYKCQMNIGHRNHFKISKCLRVSGLLCLKNKCKPYGSSM